MSDFIVKARNNGPYLIKGPLVLEKADGEREEIQQENIALCRCGGSQNKPFCDGTHRKINFEAPEVFLKKE